MHAAGRRGAAKADACYYVTCDAAGTKDGSNDMTLCPIAIAVGCMKCPASAMCPLKGVIGDYKAPENAAPKPQADEANRSK